MHIGEKGAWFPQGDVHSECPLTLRKQSSLSKPLQDGLKLELADKALNKYAPKHLDKKCHPTSSRLELDTNIKY